MSQKADSGVAVLAIFPSAEDRATLGSVFSHPNWAPRFAQTLTEAAAVVREAEIGIVIADGRLSDGRSWRDLLREMQTMPHRPLLIVASRLADDRLWAEVLDLGAYDLLLQPFDTAELMRVVSLASVSWKRHGGREPAPGGAPRSAAAEA